MLSVRVRVRVRVRVTVTVTVTVTVRARVRLGLRGRVSLREHAERRGAVRLEPVPHLVTIKVGVTLTLSLTPDLT